MLFFVRMLTPATSQDYNSSPPSIPEYSSMGLSGLSAYSARQTGSAPVHSTSAMRIGASNVGEVAAGNMRTVNRVEYSTAVAPQRQSLMVETQRFSELSRMSQASRFSELSRLSEVGTVGTANEDMFEEDLSEDERDQSIGAASPPPPIQAIPPARPPRRRPVALDLDNRDSVADDSDCSTARIAESPIPHTPLSHATFGGDGLRSRELLLSPERHPRGMNADNRLSQLSNADMADDEGESRVEALLSPEVQAQEQLPQMVPMPSFFSSQRRAAEQRGDDVDSEDGTIGLAYNESPRTSLDSFDRSSATGSTEQRRRSPDVSVSDETLLDTPQSLPASRFGHPLQARSFGSGSSNDGSANGVSSGLAPPLVIDDKPRVDHLSKDKAFSPTDTEQPSNSPMSPVHDSPTSLDSRWSMESRAAAKIAARNGFYALGDHPQLTVEQRKSLKDASAAYASQVSIAPSTFSIMPEPSSTPHPSGMADARNGWANVARNPPIGRLLPTTVAPDSMGHMAVGPPPAPGSLDSHMMATSPPRHFGSLDPSPMPHGTPPMQGSAASDARSPPMDPSRPILLDGFQSPRSEALRRQGATIVGRMQTELANSRHPVPITFRFDDDAPPLAQPSASPQTGSRAHVGVMSPPSQRYNSPRPAPPAPSAPGLPHGPPQPYRKGSLGSNGHGVSVHRSDSGHRPSVDSARRFTPPVDGRQYTSTSESGHQGSPSPLSGPVVNRLGNIDMPARRTPPVELVPYGTPSSETSCYSTPPNDIARRVASPPTLNNRSVSDDHHTQAVPTTFKPVLPSAAARAAEPAPSPMAVFLGTAANEPPKPHRFNHLDESMTATPQAMRADSPRHMTPPFARGGAPATPNSFDSVGTSSPSKTSQPQPPTHRARSRSFSAALAKSFGRKPSLDLPPPIPGASSGRKPSLDLTPRKPTVTIGRKPSLELAPRFATVTNGRKPSLDMAPRVPAITTQFLSSSPAPSHPPAPAYLRTNTDMSENSTLSAGSWKSSARMSANSTIAVHHMKLGESVHHMAIGNEPPVPSLSDYGVHRNPSLQLERSAPPLQPPSQLPFAGHQRSASGPGSWSGGSVERSASGSGHRPSGSIRRQYAAGISSKDYADPMVRTDGMEFEILQPRSKATAPVVKLNLDSSDLGLLPPEELARDGLEPLVPDTPPETDEWGFLRDRSPTPAIFHSRKTAGDIRALEQKWRSTISTPLNRNQAIPKKVKRMIIEQGVPASLRGRIWGWLMSNGVSGRVPGLFSRLVSNEPSPFDAQIDHDVAKVYADHAVFFRQESPGQQDLRTLLRAYLHFSPNGYRSELALIAGALLIHSVIEDAFWLMAGLFNGVLKTYYVKDRFAFRVDLHVFGGILQGTEPQLARLFSEIGIARKYSLPRKAYADHVQPRTISLVGGWACSSAPCRGPRCCASLTRSSLRVSTKIGRLLTSRPALSVHCVTGGAHTLT